MDETALNDRLDRLEQQIINIHELLVEKAPRIDFDDEGDAKKQKGLPLNVKEITLEEIQAFYHDCYFPPIYRGDFDGDVLEKESMTDVFYEYQKEASYAVVEQSSAMDKFLDHISGAMVSQAAKVTLRCPLAFSYNGEYYQLMGYSVTDKCVLSQIFGFFLYPNISDFIREKKLKASGKMTQDEIFEKHVLGIDDIRCLWAEVIAYALLLAMDLKEGRYVDRKRSSINMATFENLKRKAAGAFIRHWTRHM